MSRRAAACVLCSHAFLRQELRDCDGSTRLILGPGQQVSATVCTRCSSLTRSLLSQLGCDKRSHSVLLLPPLLLLPAVSLMRAQHTCWLLWRHKAESNVSALGHPLPIFRSCLKFHVQLPQHGRSNGNNGDRLRSQRRHIRPGACGRLALRAAMARMMTTNEPPVIPLESTK